MPVFDVTLNGKTYEIDAPTAKDAAEAADQHVRSSAARPVQAKPAAAAPARPPVVASRKAPAGSDLALQHARQRAKTVPGPVRAASAGMGLTFTDELEALNAGFETGLGNTVARVLGRPGVGYTAEQARRAVMQAEREASEDFARRHPVISGAYNLAGAVATGGGGANLIKGAATPLQAFGRSAAVGGAYGTVAGAGSAQGGLPERLVGAGKGGAVGTVAGAAAPVLVRAAQATPGLARRLGSGTSESVTRVRNMAGRVSPQAEQTPATTRRAEEFVAELAARTGVTVDDLLSHPAVLAGKPITAAEAIGRPAMGQLMALGRRDGVTPDALEAMLAARAQEAPARIVDDIGKVTGIAPEWAAGDFQTAADRLRAAAAPFYDEAFGVGAVQSTRLDDLARRPSVQEAMRRGVKIAREEGESPEVLGLFHMDAPPPARQIGAPSDPTDDIAELFVGGDRPKGRGMSLLEFIARKGGMNEMGELGAMDAQTFHRNRAFMPKLIKETGDSADGMAMRAWEAGYFPEFRTRPEPNVLFDAIRAELAGKPRYAQAAGDAAERAQALQALDRELGEAGISGVKAPEAGRRLMAERQEREGLESLANWDGVNPPTPVNEPVFGAVPSMKAWDYVKRGLGDVVEDYRDSTTRKLNLNAEGRAVVGTLAQLRDELVDLNPLYAKALNAGGEPLRLEDAFRSGKDLMGPRIPERVFHARLAEMSDAEKQAALGGWVNHAYEQARNMRLRPREFRNPAFQSKLRQLIGREPAARLTALLDQEALLARGGRMAPGTNSVTEEVRQAAQELDRGTGVLADLQRRLDGGQSLFKAVPATVAQTVASPVAGFLRGVQAPHNQATRDQIGELLMMSPQELAERLRNIPNLPLRPFHPELVAPAGNISGQLSGQSTP